MKKTLGIILVFAVLAASVATGAAKAAQNLSVSSAAAVLMDAETGFVMYDKNMNEQHYPASTTKIMTALLLIEYAAENGWDERVVMSENAVNGIEPGSSNIAMAVGETLGLEQCLYALLLASANEVAVAVAEHISGSVEAFAVLMNERAAGLGAKNTNFTNPHGLTDKNHYTTAYDMALIMRGALKHNKFREAISAKQYVIPPTERDSEARILYNKNRLVQSGEYINNYATGGKTGYTQAARHTLATYAEYDGASLICITLKAESYFSYPDTIALLDYGFSRYEEYYPFETYADYAESLGVSGFTAVPADSAPVKIPLGFPKEDIKTFVSLPVEVAAPSDGEAVGSITLFYGDSVLTETQLIARALTDEGSLSAAPLSTGVQRAGIPLANESTSPLISSTHRDIRSAMFLYGLAGLAAFFAVLLLYKALLFGGAKTKSATPQKKRAAIAAPAKSYRYK